MMVPLRVPNRIMSDIEFPHSLTSARSLTTHIMASIKGRPSASGASLRSPAIVPGVVRQLTEAKLFHKRQNVDARGPAQFLLQPLPVANRVFSEHAAARRSFPLADRRRSCLRGKSRKDTLRGRAPRSGPASSNRRIRWWRRTIYRYSFQLRHATSAQVHR